MRARRAAAPLVRAALILAATALSSCGGPPAPDRRTEIEAVLAAQVAAWNRGDIAGFMEGYWKSDSLLFTSGGTARRGWKGIYEKYAARYDTREKMGTLSYRELEHHDLGSGAAWVFGRWELERSGDRPGGVFTIVLRRFPEGWRIVHDHTSSDPE